MKLLILITLSTLSLFALDINEALQRAMKNSPSLKEKELLLLASKQESNIARSNFKPTLNISYAYNKFSKKSFVGADSASSASAVLGYNLFNGFSDKFNLLQSKENEKSATYLHDAAKADLRLQVYLAYINYLRAQEQISVSQNTIKLLEQQREDAKNFYEQGLFAKNDYLQVDVELSSAQQAFLVSKRNIKIAFYKLKYLLGSDLLESEKIKKISRQEKEIAIPRLKRLITENRSELKLLKAQKQALKYAYKASASQFYPTIDAEIKYQVAGEDPIPNGGATFQIHDQGTASIKLAWTLYQGGAGKAERSMLYHQESASNERLNSLYLELDFQLEEATESYKLAKNQISVATKALEQAEENFRITKNQFDANIANTSLMLDAQRFLARTQVEYYAAYFSLYDAMAEIERVVETEVF